MNRNKQRRDERALKASQRNGAIHQVVIAAFRKAKEYVDFLEFVAPQPTEDIDVFHDPKFWQKAADNLERILR